jgi:hypothetical protein
VAFADGHVAWVGSHINLKVWRAMGTMSGGEAIDPVER